MLNCNHSLVPSTWTATDTCSGSSAVAPRHRVSCGCCDCDESAVRSWMTEQRNLDLKETKNKLKQVDSILLLSRSVLDQ